MKQKRAIWLFFAVVVIGPITAFKTIKWYQNNFQSLPVLGPEKHIIRDFQFTDQMGHTVSLKDWKNKIVVANFFFTHCPVTCPKMMYQLKRVQAYGNKNVLINSFSVDPERDSVGRLSVYAGQSGIKNNWALLTGEKTALYRFARKELMIIATDGDGGPGDFIHSETFVLIDPLQRIRGFYKGTDPGEVNRLIHDIDKIEAGFHLVTD